MSHHGSESPYFRKVSVQDLKLGATGEYPHGKADETDEGEIRIAVAADRSAGIVRLEFGKPTAWIGFTPEQAGDLADMLRKKAWEVKGIGVK